MAGPSYQLAAIAWLEGTPFWLLLAVGILLVGFDIFLTSDNHVMWIGVAVLAAAAANAVHLPGEAQVGVFVVTLIACMIYVRRLVQRLPRVEHQASSAIELRGTVGVVLEGDEFPPACARVRIHGQGEWRVAPERDGLRFTAGERVRVVRRDGTLLYVEPVRS